MRNLLADPVLDAKPSCITVHPEFASVCLCRTVLTISMHAYKYEYGSSDIPEDENRYIYIYIYLRIEIFGFHSYSFNSAILLNRLQCPDYCKKVSKCLFHQVYESTVL